MAKKAPVDHSPAVRLIFFTMPLACIIRLRLKNTPTQPPITATGRVFKSSTMYSSHENDGTFFSLAFQTLMAHLPYSPTHALTARLSSLSPAAWFKSSLHHKANVLAVNTAGGSGMGLSINNTAGDRIFSTLTTVETFPLQAERVSDSIRQRAVNSLRSWFRFMYLLLCL